MKITFLNSLKSLVLFLAIYPIIALSTPINFDSRNGNNMVVILSIERGENEVKDFINNVLRQCDANKFVEIAHKALVNNSGLNNAELYNILSPQISKTTPLIPFLAKLKALHYQQGILSKQLKQFIGDKALKSYVEIGTPGSYINSLKKLVPIEKAVVINDKQGILDYAHGLSWSISRYFKSYDKIIPLSNYDAIPEDEIPSNSVNVVSCVIGLHHIPVEKLQAFMQSIYRILKPGGIFILRDHDAKDDNIKSIVQAAHTIYNLVTLDLNLDGELKEYRNFQPLQHWIDLLKLEGFSYPSNERLHQEGDPTQNTMIKFVKPLAGQDDIVLELEDDPSFKREYTRTLLTSAEWQNVFATVEYTKLIYDKPFYDFPFFASISSFWEVFGKSWNEARKYDSFWNVLTNEYTTTNLFVGCFTTIEFAFKGIISAPLGWIFNDDSNLHKIELLVKDPDNESMVIFEGTNILKDFNMDNLKHIEVNRWRAFTDSIKRITQSRNLEIISIAGNDKIQITLKHPPAADAVILSSKGVTKLYNWDFPTLVDEKITVVTVGVRNIKEFINTAVKNNIEIFHVHDF